MSSFFPVHAEVSKGCGHALSLFNTCMDIVVDQSHCGKSIVNIRVTYLVFFSDDAVIFVESLQILVMTPEAR